MSHIDSKFINIANDLMVSAASSKEWTVDFYFDNKHFRLRKLCYTILGGRSEFRVYEMRGDRVLNFLNFVGVDVFIEWFDKQNPVGEITRETPKEEPALVNPIDIKCSNGFIFEDEKPTERKVKEVHIVEADHTGLLSARICALISMGEWEMKGEIKHYTPSGQAGIMFYQMMVKYE